MVYCSKCGNKNPDDAANCASCGASLMMTQKMRPRESEEMCFGSRSGSFWTIVFGIIIVLLGATFLLQGVGINVQFWPVLIILIGVLVVAGAISRR